MSSLYILEIKLLLVTLFANIFSQSVGCLFVVVVFYGFLCCIKLVSLIRFHLFILAFISIALGEWPKKMLLCFVSENVLPMFSSSFKALCLILKYLSILSLFLCVVWGSILTLLIYTWLSSFSNTTCWRDCLFFIVCPCLLCWVINSSISSQFF